MRKLFLLIGIYLLLSTNIFAVDLDNPSEGWIRSKIDKVGFYSGDLLELNLGNANTFAEEKLDFVKILNVPTYTYLDPNSINIPDPVTLEVISDIREGEYYVFCHVESQESYNSVSESWQATGNSNIWFAFFNSSYNGSCVYNNSSKDISLNNAGFVKIRIQRDSQSSFTQILLNINVSNYPEISYLYSVG